MAVTALSGVWTPERDARGLFVPKANGVDAPVSSTAGFISTRKFHYNYAVAGSNGIYTTVFNKILRRSDQNYGPVNLLSVNTPYGVGIDAQTGWQAGGYPTQPGGWNVPRQTWISLFYIYDAAKTITNYPRFFGGVGNNPSLRNQTISWNNPAGEQALVVSPETNYGGIEVSVNGVGNGLHCMVVTSNAGGSATGVRIFLNGQFVATTTAPSGWNGGTFPNTDFYANSVSQSGLNIGNILFTAILYGYTASDSEAQKLSTDPYSYFFQDAPKTSAKRRLFSGVLSLPDPPTEFKGGRFLPQRWKTQPQGAVQVDWNYPITQGLTTVFLPSTPNYRDIISGATDTAQYRAPMRAGSSGLALSNTNGGNPWSTLIAIPKVAGGYAALTTFCLYEQPDTTTSGAVFGAGYDGTYYQGFSKNSGGTVTFGPATNNAGLSITTAPLATNKTYALCGTARYDQNFRELYVDGVSVGTNTVNGTRLNGQFTLMGSVYQGGQNRCLSVYAFYCWRRQLSTAEIRSLYENPWQIFKPNPGRIYFLPGMIPNRSRFLFLFG